MRARTLFAVSILVLMLPLPHAAAGNFFAFGTQVGSCRAEPPLHLVVDPPAQCLKTGTGGWVHARDCEADACELGGAIHSHAWSSEAAFGVEGYLGMRGDALEKVCEASGVDGYANCVGSRAMTFDLEPDRCAVARWLTVGADANGRSEAFADIMACRRGDALQAHWASTGAPQAFSQNCRMEGRLIPPTARCSVALYAKASVDACGADACDVFGAVNAYVYGKLRGAKEVSASFGGVEACRATDVGFPVACADGVVVSVPVTADACARIPTDAVGVDTLIHTVRTGVDFELCRASDGTPSLRILYDTRR